jgi:hypothetical protein
LPYENVRGLGGAQLVVVNAKLTGTNQFLVQEPLSSAPYKDGTYPLADPASTKGKHGLCEILVGGLHRMCVNGTNLLPVAPVESAEFNADTNPDS